MCAKPWFLNVNARLQRPISLPWPTSLVKSMIQINSSPPAVLNLASDGRSSRTTESVENPMSFLQKSDLKKHLSTKAGNMTHHGQAETTEGARVILRDGNLITLPSPDLKEEAINTPEVLPID
jgi:hypothetical protein